MVLGQGLILSVIGFIPGAAISIAVYRVTGRITFLPLVMTPERLLLVYGLTPVMSMTAALLAMRPVRVVDPADIL